MLKVAISTTDVSPKNLDDKVKEDGEEQEEDDKPTPLTTIEASDDKKKEDGQEEDGEVDVEEDDGEVDGEEEDDEEEDGEEDDANMHSLRRTFLRSFWNSVYDDLRDREEMRDFDDFP